LVTTSTVPCRRGPWRETGPSRRVPHSKASLSRAMMRLRHGRVSQAAGQGIIHLAVRPVEARRTPAEAIPVAVVVERRMAAEVGAAVAVATAAAVVAAAVAAISD
ncbi:MAG: hypothetical protein ACLP07_00655, partial [Terracidiphilus sp.]